MLAILHMLAILQIPPATVLEASHASNLLVHRDVPSVQSAWVSSTARDGAIEYRALTPFHRRPQQPCYLTRRLNRHSFVRMYHIPTGDFDGGNQPTGGLNTQPGCVCPAREAPLFSLC